MVVGGLLVVKHHLAALLSNSLLVAWTLDFPALCIAVFVAKLIPASTVGAVEVFLGFLFNEYCITLAPLEATLAHVGTPSDRVTLLDGIVGNLPQLIEGNIL